MKNLLSLVALVSLCLASSMANGAEPVVPTKTAQSCPAGSAIAQRATVRADGAIVITTRCVAVSR